MLKNKNILLGITGSIAAYKAPLIIRELIKMENQVMAIMTPSALKFITKLKKFYFTTTAVKDAKIEAIIRTKKSLFDILLYKSYL